MQIRALTPAEQALVLAGISQFLTQVKVSGVVSFLLQRLKLNGSKWTSWITRETPWVSRIVAGLSALATAANITRSWNGVTGTIVISGLTLTNLAHGLVTVFPHALWASVVSYMLQHGWYKAVFAEDAKLPTAFGFGNLVGASGQQAAKKQ